MTEDTLRMISTLGLGQGTFTNNTFRKYGSAENCLAVKRLRARLRTQSAVSEHRKSTIRSLKEEICTLRRGFSSERRKMLSEMEKMKKRAEFLEARVSELLSIGK